MPTYEYECTHCGHSFEAFQKMTDQPLKKCPRCNKHLRRLISSGSGIIFKGSGFYSTDYRKKSPSENTGGSPRTMAKKSTQQEVKDDNTCRKAKEGCNACRKVR